MKASERLTTSDFNKFLAQIAQIIEQQPPVLIFQEGILPNIKVKIHNPITKETTKESGFVYPVLAAAITQATFTIFDNTNPIKAAEFVAVMEAFWKEYHLSPFIMPCVFYSPDLDATIYFFMKIPNEVLEEPILTWPQYFKEHIKERIRTGSNSSGFFTEYNVMCATYGEMIASILLGVTKVVD